MIIENTKEILKERLELLIEEKKDSDPTLSETKQAELIDIPYQTFHKYVKGIAECPIRNLAKIADYYKVSTDYLLGLSENPSTDPDIINACNVTGLSENAIKTLQRLNTPLDMEDSKIEYILNKQRNVTELIHNGKYTMPNESLTDDEVTKLQKILTYENSKEVIEILNDLLSVRSDNPDITWETYGVIILKCIYDYCKGNLLPTTYKIEDIAGITYRSLSPAAQRSIALNNLNITVQELREELKEHERNGKYNPTKK
ncbi:MAG: helix-turn-helix domain-containing protein [Ruminococcus flavefaciens]|nr:helix-turn-helix domain-containing protein [Ruminococcus flavefaciens]MCM1062241.1 helix-turn-helix domain-containing protein [Eubacterium sp.]